MSEDLLKKKARGSAKGPAGCAHVFRLALLGIAVSVIAAPAVLVGEPPGLDGDFDLSGGRSAEIQYFSMESSLVTYSLDGTRTSTDVFHLRLKCVPATLTGKGSDEYTCLSFTVIPDGAPETSIPALENWIHDFGSEGLDDEGQVFGIDHGRFEGLVDSNGDALPLDRAYHVYNAFIDFHAFCDVFAQPVPDGKGIQDLKAVGERVVHAAAFSEAPTDLGSAFAEGSSFTNGEITLEFKGLSTVNGRTCALIAYDSGESSFRMIMKPMPEMEVRTVGSSHYWGDIYKDLSTKWVQRVSMTEVVVSETTLPMPPNKMNSVVERHIVILNVSGEE